MNSMFEIKLFTAEKFETQKKAENLLKFLEQYGGPFRPTKFDRAEPIKRPFNSSNMKAATELLAGDPDHEWGGIMLKGDKFKSSVWIHWSNGEPFQTWFLFLSPAFFKRKKAPVDFFSFLKGLLAETPFVFGAAAASEEWRAKHYLITESELGTSERKVGITIEKCVPGVYWCTCFGKKLTEFFGRDRLLKLPVQRVLDLESAGMVLQMSENPFEPAEELIKREKQVIEELGSEHFFDIDNPETSCPEISKVLLK